MFCPYCGSAVDEGEKFCRNCGSKLEPSRAADTQEPSVPKAEVHAYYQKEQVQPVQQPQPQQQTWNTNAPAPAASMQPQNVPPKKKGKGGLIALIIVLAVLLIGGGIFAAFHFFGSNNKSGKTADEELRQLIAIQDDFWDKADLEKALTYYDKTSQRYLKDDEELQKNWGIVGINGAKLETKVTEILYDEELALIRTDFTITDPDGTKFVVKHASMPAIYEDGKWCFLCDIYEGFDPDYAARLDKLGRNEESQAELLEPEE